MSTTTGVPVVGYLVQAPSGMRHHLADGTWYPVAVASRLVDPDDPRVETVIQRHLSRSIALGEPISLTAGRIIADLAALKASS